MPLDGLYHFIFGSKSENASGRFEVVAVDGESFLERSQTNIILPKLATCDLLSPADYTDSYTFHILL